MSTRFKFMSVIAALAIFALLIAILSDIKSTYIELGTIKTELSQVKKQFEDYQTLVQKVNEIDTKFTKDLADAKAKNDKLYDNVINGIGRLQFNIDKATTGGAADAACTGLSDSAQRNYFILRERIEQSRLQIEGLQNYIKNVCLSD